MVVLLEAGNPMARATISAFKYNRYPVHEWMTSSTPQVHNIRDVQFIVAETTRGFWLFLAAKQLDPSGEDPVERDNPAEDFHILLDAHSLRSVATAIPPKTSYSVLNINIQQPSSRSSKQLCPQAERLCRHKFPRSLVITITKRNTVLDGYYW